MDRLGFHLPFNIEPSKCQQTSWPDASASSDCLIHSKEPETLMGGAGNLKINMP